MRKLRSFFILLLAFALLVASSSSAQACAACFGKSDSTMAKGMNMGIFALLIVVVGVLSSFFCAGVYFVRRASQYAAAQQSLELSQNS
ncbi:MAG: hypothetical protein JWN25_3440 [Verrucomicrobiales bacterium]|nr:hypothetical protein [Verrucomicrobiales bacterium]